MKIDATEVMTVPEVADYLRIPKSSVYGLAQTGRIPCQKVGRHWRFHRNAIDRWLSQDPMSVASESNSSSRDGT